MADNDTTPDERPSPIPTPPEFPVVWENPEDEGMFWQSDMMHFPEPTTPLMDLWEQAFNQGFVDAAEASEVPIVLVYKRINTWEFNTVMPRVPPEEMEAQGHKGYEHIRNDVGRLWEWWTDDLLPEIQSHLGRWESFDLEGASMEALLAHLDETQRMLTRLWDIHFEVGFPFLMAPSMFEDFYNEHFDAGSYFEPFRLLQGYGNKTVEAGHALWASSRKALDIPVVLEALGHHVAADVIASLEAGPEGRDFLVEFREFLDEFGQRSDVFAELGNRGWIENPDTPIKNLQDFVAQPDRDLPAELAELAAERDQATAEAREALGNHPQDVRDEFEFLLSPARAGQILNEDHNHYIDQRGMHRARLVLLEFGRRLADAGTIDQRDDVFYLMLDELKSAARALPSGDHRHIVSARKAEMERFRAVRPPAAVGTPPPGPPPDDPVSRSFMKFFGAPPRESEEANTIHGNPGAPGKVRGTAKVVRSLAQAGKIQPGDVLVAPGTMPAWTPLFGSIAAVVTDAGGVLSHAAIVAREYGIPAVLGTQKATAVIRDGQTVEVDGDHGVVTILS